MRHDFKSFPTNIQIQKFFFLIFFAIKILLDNTYGLLDLLEFALNHFNIIFLAESKFQMLARNDLKLCLNAGSQISVTLVSDSSQNHI